MTPLPSMSQVYEWIKYACERNGAPGLTQFISVTWKKNYTHRMGTANFFPDKLIALSIPLFERAPIEEQRDTVIHEACHIIARHKAGHRIKPHGYEWKFAMRTAGLQPKRCHSVKLVGIAPVVFVCNCKEHHVTKNKATRIRKHLGTEQAYYCKICKGNLKIKS